MCVAAFQRASRDALTTTATYTSFRRAPFLHLSVPTEKTRLGALVASAVVARRPSSMRGERRARPRPAVEE